MITIIMIITTVQMLERERESAYGGCGDKWSLMKWINDVLRRWEKLNKKILWRDEREREREAGLYTKGDWRAIDSLQTHQSTTSDLVLTACASLSFYRGPLISNVSFPTDIRLSLKNSNWTLAYLILIAFLIILIRSISSKGSSITLVDFVDCI